MFVRSLLTAAGAAAIILGAALTPSGASADDIVIGLSVPDTGAAALGALWQRWGIDMAVDEINAAGGLLGRKVTTLAYDNRCNPSEAVNVANKLIEAKVVAILGAQCSTATLATMPLIAQAKIPMIEGIATAPNITDLSGKGGNPWVFRINPSDQDMMDALGIYLQQNTHIRNIAAVGEDSDFGRGGVAAFQAVAKKVGLNVISTDFYQQNQPDFTALLTKLQQRHPDAVALFQLSTDQLNFLRTAMQMGLKMAFTGRFDPGGANTPIVQAGGLEGSITAWTYSADVDAPLNQAFVKKVEALHKVSPPLQTWAGYDAMRLLGQAIKDANSDDPVKIRDAIQNITFTNVMGAPVKFDDHNQGGRDVVIEEITADKAVVKKLLNLAQ